MTEARLRPAERQQAAQRVRDAARAGVIVGLDADRRLELAREASTSAELELITRDLPWAAVPPPAQLPRTNPFAPPAEPGPDSRTRGRSHPVQVVVGVVAVLCGLGVVLGVLSSTGSEDVSTFSRPMPDEAGMGAAPAVPVAVLDGLSKRGWRRMVADLEQTRGTTDVVALTVRPDGVLLRVPRGSGTGTVDYTWDGSLRSTGNRGRDPGTAFDLETIDRRVLRAALRDVEGAVGGAASSELVVRAPVAGDGWVQATATNVVGERSRVIVDLEGRVLTRS